MAESVSLQALPPSIKIAVEERVLLPLPAQVTYLVSDDKRVLAGRVQDGVELLGKAPGRTIVFFADGAAARAVTVLVERRAVARPEASVSERADDLRITTGGLVALGQVGLRRSLMGASRQDSSSFLLRGRAPGLSYRLGVHLLRTGEAWLWPELSARAETEHVELYLGDEVTLGEFRPFPQGGALRGGRMALSLGSVGAEVAAAGPRRLDSPGLRFPYQRYAARYRLSPELEAGLGALLSLERGAPLFALPFAGASWRTRSLRARVHLGTAGRGADGRPTFIVAATAQATGDPCSGSATYASPLLGGTAPTALVPHDRHAFLLAASCEAGGAQVHAGLRAGDVGPQGDAGPIASAQARYGWERLSLGVTGAWSLSGAPDPRSALAAFLQSRLGGGRIEAAARLSPMADGTLARNEILRIAYRAAWLEPSLTATLHHRASGWSAAGLEAGGRFDVGGAVRGDVGASATYLPHRAALSPLQVRWRIEFQPWRAYSLTFAGYLVPASGARGLTLGAVYSFGDELPREPLLSPLRSTTVYVEVYEDVDGDGRRDPGEPPIPGLVVCADGKRCVPTDAGGRWAVSDLEEGPHDVLANATALPEWSATTPPLARVTTGTYLAPRHSFGFVREGQIRVHFFNDANYNLVRDPGEPAFSDVSVSIRGPGVQKSVPAGEAGAVLRYRTPGAFTLEIDPATVPAGHQIPVPEVILHESAFRAQEVHIPLHVIRSIRGRVCVDADDDGRCHPSEMGVGNLRVQLGDRWSQTDTGGFFLFTPLPQGVHTLAIPDGDQPPGLVQREPITVQLGDKPQDVAAVAVPLTPRIAVVRRERVALERGGRSWGLELGGYLTRGAPFRQRRPALSSGERTALDRVAALFKRSLVRSRDTRLVLTAFAAAAAHRVDPQAALDEARATAVGALLWLGRTYAIDPSTVVLDPPAAPLSEEVALQLRVVRPR